MFFGASGSEVSLCHQEQNREESKAQNRKYTACWAGLLQFQTQFFSGPRSIKHNLVCYQTPYCVYFTANAKASEKQTRPK
jgi:hypothetical protein